MKRSFLNGIILVLSLLAGGCARHPPAVREADGIRVVSLAPNLTEIIWAIGAGSNLVGRTSACDYPPEMAKTVPVVGGFGTPSLDKLVMADPTLVLEVDLENESVGKLIERIGLNRKRVKCSSLNDIPDAILAVGDYMDRRDYARELADLIRKRINEFRSDAERSDGPLVYVEIWSDPLMTAGRGSFVSDLVSLAGGRNIGDDVFRGEYFSVSPEWVIARDPEVIICLYMSDERTIGSVVGARLGWGGIRAVRDGRVFGGLNSSAILRPGPRVLEGIEILRDCIDAAGTPGA